MSAFRPVNRVTKSNDTAPHFYVHGYDKRRNRATEDIDVILGQQWISWTNESIFDEQMCGRINIMPSCATSKIKLLNIDTNTETVTVGIYLYDAYSNSQTYDGDVILLWAESIPPGGRAPGRVTDHMNGTYSGSVRVHWSGQTRIFAKVASARKTFCLRLQAMKKYGNSVFALQKSYGIQYRFVSDSGTEFTRCAPIPFVFGYKQLCNFTSLNGGFSWFCGKPTQKGLNCLSYNKFMMKPYNKDAIVPRQPKLLILRDIVCFATR